MKEILEKYCDAYLIEKSNVYQLKNLKFFPFVFILQIKPTSKEEYVLFDNVENWFNKDKPRKTYKQQTKLLGKYHNFHESEKLEMFFKSLE